MQILENVHEDVVVDGPDPELRRQEDGWQRERVFVREEGGGSDAGPRAPAAQRPLLGDAIDLGKDGHPRQVSSAERRSATLTEGAPYACHALPAHDEGRVQRHHVGTHGGGARGVVACFRRREGGGQLGFEEVLLHTVEAESEERPSDLLLQHNSAEKSVQDAFHALQ